MRDLTTVFPEVTDVSLNEGLWNLISHLPEHKEMLQTIKDSLPEVQRATSLFYKTQSQFMDNMLTVSHPTPLRNIRQILSEMNRTREAIKEAHFSCLKHQVEIKMKRRELDTQRDPLKQELLGVEIMELHSKIDSKQGYISGAIRKLANYTEQYKAIVETHGLQGFNEADFEREEERYHIMKAFEQGVTAARTRGGVIDEGNMIYLTQIGINGASAQYEVSQYLKTEGMLLQEGKDPTHKMFTMFLERMAEKYQGHSKILAHRKGMRGTMTEGATLQAGDTRLIPEKAPA